MPDRRLEHSEELEHVLGHAVPEERAVLAMRFLHGWSHSRIASALSISEGAARVRVHRALRSVRSRVRDGDRVGGSAALALTPVAGLSTARLDETIGSVLRDAHVQLGTAQTGATAASEAPRLVNRLGAFGLGAGGLLVTLVLGGSATVVFESADVVAEAAPIVRSLADLGARGTAGETSAEGATSSSPFAGGIPRPADWDTGALGRLGRGESRLADAPRTPDTDPADTPVPVLPEAPQVEAPVDDMPLAERPSETSRPMVEEACAARCDLYSSEGERAGVSGGPVATPHPRSAPEIQSQASAPMSAAAVVDPVDDVGSAATAPTARSFVELEAHEVELVRQAALLLQPIVGEELAQVDLNEPTHARRALKRETRRVRRKYRRARAKLRKAVSTGDADGARVASAKAVRLSAVGDVLGFLLEVVTLDPTAPLDAAPRLPEGVDVAGALTTVIDVFSVPRGDEVEIDPDEPTPSALDVDTSRLPEFLFR